jgi:hypothetical protein
MSSTSTSGSGGNGGSGGSKAEAQGPSVALSSDFPPISKFFNRPQVREFFQKFGEKIVSELMQENDVKLAEKVQLGIEDLKGGGFDGEALWACSKEELAKYLPPGIAMKLYLRIHGDSSSSASALSKPRSENEK